MPVTTRTDVVERKIWLSAEWRWKEQIQTIPGSKWSVSDNQWSIPLTWSSCLALRSIFKDELQLDQPLIDWATRLRTERIDPCLAIRDASNWPEKEDGSDSHLHWWQRSGVEFIRRGERVLISDVPGSGKTCTSILGLKEIRDAGNEVFPCLVVCPKSMKKSWEREFSQWWPEVNVQVVSGTPAKRRKQLESDADVFVLHFESLRSHSRLASYGSIALKRCVDCGGSDPAIKPGSCHAHVKELNHIDFRSTIVDECHRVKDASSQQARALKASLGDAKYRIALTGTPMANDVTDLWPILNLLDPHEFPTRSKWIDRYVEYMTNPFGGMLVLGIKPTAREEFAMSFYPRMRRMTEDVILSFLPPVIFKRRDCEMLPKQAKAYKQMEEKFVATLDDSVAVASSPIIQAMRLSQFASSFAEVDTTTEVDEHGFEKIKQSAILTEPSGKLDAFMEDIEGFGDSQVAVMAVSRQLIMLLSARLEKAGIPHGLVVGGLTEDERQNHIDDFQSGKTKFILFTSGAGGTGITLTAARYLCRLQIPFSFIDYVQTMGRVRRIGSERHENIIVIDYVSEGTIDEHVFDVVAVKQENFEDVVKDREQVRKILGE